MAARCENQTIILHGFTHKYKIKIDIQIIAANKSLKLKNFKAIFS